MLGALSSAATVKLTLSALSDAPTESVTVTRAARTVPSAKLSGRVISKLSAPRSDHFPEAGRAMACAGRVATGTPPPTGTRASLTERRAPSESPSPVEVTCTREPA